MTCCVWGFCVDIWVLSTLRTLRHPLSTDGKWRKRLCPFAQQSSGFGACPCVRPGSSGLLTCCPVWTCCSWEASLSMTRARCWILLPMVHSGQWKNQKRKELKASTTLSPQTGVQAVLAGGKVFKMWLCTKGYTSILSVEKADTAWQRDGVAQNTGLPTSL